MPPFYDFCSFWCVAVNTRDKLQFLSFILFILQCMSLHLFVCWIWWCVQRLDFHLQMIVQHQSFHAWILTVTRSLLFSMSVSFSYCLSHAAEIVTVWLICSSVDLGFYVYKCFTSNYLGLPQLAYCCYHYVTGRKWNALLCRWVNICILL